MLTSESNIYALMNSAELAYSLHAPGASKGRPSFLRNFIEKKLQSGRIDAETAKLLRKRFMSVRPSSFLSTWEAYYRCIDQTATFLRKVADMTDLERLKSAVNTFDEAQGPLTSMFGESEFVVLDAEKLRFSNFGLFVVPKECQQGFSDGWIATHIDTAFVGRDRTHMYSVIATLQRYGFLVLSDQERRFNIEPKLNLLRLKSSATNPLGPAAIASAKQNLLIA